MFSETKALGPSEYGKGNLGGMEGLNGSKQERQEWQTLRKRRNSIQILSLSPISGQSSTGRLDQSTVVSICG